MTEISDDIAIAYRQFGAVADTLPIAIGIWADAGMPYANPAFLALTGRGADELRHLGFTALLSEGDRDGVNALRRDVASGGRSLARSCVTLVRRGGEALWIQQTLTRSGSGDSSGVIVTAVDTAGLRFESERGGADRSSPWSVAEDLNAMAELSPAGVIVEANQALARLFAVEPPEALIGRSLAAFVQDPIYLSQVLAAAAGQRVESAELQARRSDGAPIIVKARLVPTFGPGRQCTSLQIVLVEITDRKRLEAHLAGIQRTEAIGRLAGGLAHDFNNLLTVIGGHSDYLLQTLPDSDPRRPSAQSIKHASHRAAALTRQLLAFGRRQVFHLRVVDIGQLLEETRPILMQVVGGRIDLQIEVGEGSPAIKADPAQVEEVLVNLALNARGALAEDGVLTIQAGLLEIGERAPRERPWIRRGRYLRIDVTDSGPGMDEAVRARVFEPFYSTTLMGRGDGLGLATVYGIVKQSDGYIWVESEVGHGTTFTMLFPAWVPIDQAQPVPRHEAVPREIVPTETVVIVESDDTLRALLADALRRRGYHVLDAESALRAEALLEAHAGRIDLFVADTPDGEAIMAVVDRLRAAEPRLRVLLMSSTPVAPFAASRTAAIQKPFSLLAFANQVRQILDVETDPL